MKSKLSLLALAAVVALGACSKKSAPPPAPAAAPAEQPAAVATAPAAKPGVEGKWEGNSGEDMPVSFTVEGGKVTGVYAGMKGQKDGCSVFASFGGDDAPLSGKSFASHGKHDDFEFNLTGNLTSDTEASGTIDWKTNTTTCGAYNVQLKWTAKKLPPEADDDMGDE
ncbi:MAG TPA: hypothetical protein VFX30_01960 [bacterium]|nr:hypothetical protein [bacterium]